MKTAAMALLLLMLSACAGVTITPISAQQERAAHSGGSSISGYIVYAPIIVFNVGETEVCTKVLQKDEACPANSIKRICAVGNPMVLPDYSKPFSVEIQTGLGKAGADIQIADGWRLTGVKDNSDNTALLGFLQKAIGMSVAPADAACKDAGLYRWTTGETPTLEKLFPK